ncbi:uncharacterized protein LOC144652330 [Oculina patagonica]
MLQDKTGMVHEINLNETPTHDAEKESITSGQKGPNPPTPGESCKERKAQCYHNLPDDEKDKVKSILYIMDKFSVSVQAYHELSQQEPAFPRSSPGRGMSAIL